MKWPIFNINQQFHQYIFFILHNTLQWMDAVSLLIGCSHHYAYFCWNAQSLEANVNYIQCSCSFQQLWDSLNSDWTFAEIVLIFPFISSNRIKRTSTYSHPPQIARERPGWIAASHQQVPPTGAVMHRYPWWWWGFAAPSKHDACIHYTTPHSKTGC